MKFILQIILILSVLAINQGLEVPADDEAAGVVTLTDDNFEKMIEYNKYVLVDIYAPWCGHCKTLNPEFRKAAFILQEANSPVILGKLDGTVHSVTAKKYDVKGFPTLIWFENGVKSDYIGGRTGGDIAKWIQKKTGQQVTILENQEQYDKFQQDNKVGIAYFGQESGNTYEMFNEIALEQEKLNFAIVSDTELIKKSGFAENSIVSLKSFGDGNQVYKGQLVKKDIISFINASQLDVVMEFDEIAVQAVFMRKNPAIFFFHNHTPESNEQFEIFKELANQNQDKGLIFTVTSPNDGHGQWTQLANYLQLDNKQAPFAHFTHMTPTQVVKDKLEGTLTRQTLQEFIDKHNQSKKNKKQDL